MIGLSTTGVDAAHLRTAFAPGEAITLWIQVNNAATAPVSPLFDFTVRNDLGQLVPELSWSGAIEAVAGPSWFKLERTVPGTVQTGAHTFTGAVTYAGQNTSLASEIYFAQTLRVADDFADASSGWPAGSDGSATWGYFDGEYRISLNRANLWLLASHPGGPNLTDFVVEADMRRPGTAAGWVGLVFGVNQTGSDFHLVEIDRVGQYSFFHNVSGQWETLVSPTASVALRTGDAVNHLMLVRDSGLTWLYANGQMVTMVTDLPAPTGRVGVYASNGDAGLEGRFDTFRGYALR